jgi:hypothetical protein
MPPNARLRLIHPARAIFLDGQFDVRAQLLIEIGIELFAAEECCGAAKENPDPVHNRLLNSTSGVIKRRQIKRFLAIHPACFFGTFTLMLNVYL